VQPMSSVNTLANLDRVRIALAKARTLPEIVNIRNLAEAARTYAKSGTHGERCVALILDGELAGGSALGKLEAPRRQNRFAVKNGRSTS